MHIGRPGTRDDPGEQHAAFQGDESDPWNVVRDPEERGLRHLVHVKSNESMASSLCFETPGPRIVWRGPSTYSPYDLEAASEKPTKATLVRQWLPALLSAGPMPQAKLHQLFEQVGIGIRTVEGVKKELGVVSTREATGWVWSLGEKEA